MSTTPTVPVTPATTPPVITTTPVTETPTPIKSENAREEEGETENREENIMAPAESEEEQKSPKK